MPQRKESKRVKRVLGTFAWALGLVALAGPVLASPASLRSRLESFGTSGKARGLRYGVVFLPLGPGDLFISPLPEPELSREETPDLLDSLDVAAPPSLRELARLRDERLAVQGAGDETMPGARGTSRAGGWKEPPADPSTPTSTAGTPGTGTAGCPDCVRVNGDLALTPASVTKLVTTLATLEAFGPRYTLHTEVFGTGPLVDGVLSGDLVVRGGGDPFLVTERVWLLVEALRAKGLRKVEGRLLLDERLFAAEIADSARSQRERSDRPYAAPLAPFSVNFNAAAVRVAPGARAGEAALASIDPITNSYLHLDARVRTVASGRAASWSISIRAATAAERDSLGVGLDSLQVREVLTVRGSVAEGADSLADYASVREPGLFAISAFRSFLEAGGISVSGRTALGPTPPQARLLVDFPSLPLTELVESTNRFSNNLMADLLAMSYSRQPGRPTAGGDYANLGSLRAPLPPASLTAGARLLSRWLRSELGTPPGIELHDGSGLSYRNRLSADALARVLARAWNDLDTRGPFLSSLPAPGEFGTLRSRFRRGGDPIPLRAKTGTLGDVGVSTLAGYVDDPVRGVVAFAILMNGGGSRWSVSAMHDLQEDWVTEYLR